MEVGSMIPLEISTSKHYIKENPDLPSEEARRVQFSKR
jgi:hypothetical protein